MSIKLYNRVRDMPVEAFKVNSTGREAILARKSILLSLAMRSDNEGKCFVSYRRLAADTGMHMFSAQRAVTDLCRLGHLSVDMGDGRASNTYTVHPVVTTPSMHKPDAATNPDNPVVTTRSDWGDHSEWPLKVISEPNDPETAALLERANELIRAQREAVA